MNEFVAKKLGEVLAFSNLGIELFERGETALKEALQDYDEMKIAFDEQANKIKQIADDEGTHNKGSWHALYDQSSCYQPRKARSPAARPLLFSLRNES